LFPLLWERARVRAATDSAVENILQFSNAQKLYSKKVYEYEKSPVPKAIMGTGA
jgi:hypothetical protein